MEQIITQLQALATQDTAALEAIVTALQALPTASATVGPAVTLVSVVATFSDGSTQSLPVATA